jgi:hypothetical protein
MDTNSSSYLEKSTHSLQSAERRRLLEEYLAPTVDLLKFQANARCAGLLRDVGYKPKTIGRVEE